MNMFSIGQKVYLNGENDSKKYKVDSFEDEDGIVKYKIRYHGQMIEKVFLESQLKWIK